MHHDQRHIPIKMVGFKYGANVPSSLPMIRTSVDHGTAYRHAGPRSITADPRSLTEVIELASQRAKKQFKA
mgnify:CR=1 FL=1